MPCTTLLVGRKATNDGSTMVSRTDDGHFDEKKTIIVEPNKQPRKYKSVISHVEIDLPDNPVRYTACPSVDSKNGIWAATGINAYNVGMTATETITSNPRVLGADPYVKYQKAKSKKEKDVIGGIGEEDIVVLVLPYIKTAKEGVKRLGELLEKYGTYEPNGIAFNDSHDVWWLETIGGHHWIARRVDDEEYVVMPNQFGLDKFDFDDAYGKQENNMCSKDLKEFVQKYHLDLNQDGKFNPRNAFGSRRDADHVYNTPRAWFMARYFNPRTYKWDGEDADYTPESDDIPWSLKPERKITIEDVKYVLSSYYQGTKYNPYTKVDNIEKGIYRPIGISRTGVTSICQIRPYVDKEISAVEWIGYGSNAFNTFIPLYTNVSKIPAYLSNVTLDVDTNNFYWSTRLIGALVDPIYGKAIQLVERYQNQTLNLGQQYLNEYDEKYLQTKDLKVLEEANEKIALMAKEETQDALNKILYQASLNMKNGYSRSDN